MTRRVDGAQEEQSSSTLALLCSIPSVSLFAGQLFLRQQRRSQQGDAVATVVVVGHVGPSFTAEVAEDGGQGHREKEQEAAQQRRLRQDGLEPKPRGEKAR